MAVADAVDGRAEADALGHGGQGREAGPGIGLQGRVIENEDRVEAERVDPAARVEQPRQPPLADDELEPKPNALVGLGHPRMSCHRDPLQLASGQVPGPAPTDLPPPVGVAYRMKLLRSSSAATSPTRSPTNAASMTTVCPWWSGGVEGDLLQDLLDDRVQPARPDVLGAGVDLGRQPGHLAQPVFGELEVHAFGRQQGGVLLGQRVLRLGQDRVEVFFGQTAQLDPDREAALQLGDQVGGAGVVEGAGGDEEDVVGLDRAVAGHHDRALDDRQQVALDPFARDIGAVVAVAADRLVDLVDEDDRRRPRPGCIAASTTASKSTRRSASCWVRMRRASRTETRRRARRGGGT